MSFADLKSSKNNLSKLIAAAGEASDQKATTKSYVDDRIWKTYCR